MYKFNGKEKKCATCEYFCGPRELEKGILGSSLYVDVKSNHGNFCSKHRTKRDLKSGGINYGTSCYQRWSALELEYQNIKQRKEEKAEQKRIAYEQIRNSSSYSPSGYGNNQTYESTHSSSTSSSDKLLKRYRIYCKRKNDLATESRKVSKAADRVEHWHKYYLIKCIVITGVGFVISWLPTIITSLLANAQKWAANQLIELGHKITESDVQEYMSLYDKLHTTSLFLMLIPLLVLIIGVVIYFAFRENAYKKALANKTIVEEKVKELGKEMDELNSYDFTSNNH